MTDKSTWTFDQWNEEIKRTGVFPILYKKDSKTKKNRFWAVKIVTEDNDKAHIDVIQNIQGKLYLIRQDDRKIVKSFIDSVKNIDHEIWKNFK